jgi:hypothetical protein
VQRVEVGGKMEGVGVGVGVEVGGKGRGGRRDGEGGVVGGKERIGVGWGGLGTRLCGAGTSLKRPPPTKRPNHVIHVVPCPHVAPRPQLFDEEYDLPIYMTGGRVRPRVKGLG